MWRYPEVWCRSVVVKAGVMTSGAGWEGQRGQLAQEQLLSLLAHLFVVTVHSDARPHGEVAFSRSVEPSRPGDVGGVFSGKKMVVRLSLVTYLNGPIIVAIASQTVMFLHQGYVEIFI